MKFKARLIKTFESFKRNWWLFLLQGLCVAPLTLFMIGADYVLEGKVALNGNNSVMFEVAGIQFTYVHFMFTLYVCFFSILFVSLLLCLYLLLWQIIDKRNKKYDRQIESKK